MIAINARKLSFGFFILISTWEFISVLVYAVRHGLLENYYMGLTIAFLFALAYPFQLWYKRKHADLVLGALSLAVSLYMILAYLDDLFDWTAGIDHYSNPPLYFGGWGLFVLAMNVMSILMINSGRSGKSRTRP